MKGSARLINTTTRAHASVIGQIHGKAMSGTCPLSGSAYPTDEVNVLKYLRVMPEQPQELVWLVPQVGIDYTLESNTKWIVK